MEIQPMPSDSTHSAVGAVNGMEIQPMPSDSTHSAVGAVNGARLVLPVERMALGVTRGCRGIDR
jgi:hypothetical protein